jgi:1-deoxy-D-xylulose-5-phosphate reductoisomerase
MLHAKRVLVLGSTGSIGASTLQVVDNLAGRLVVSALAAHRQWEQILQQVARYRPEAVALSDEDAARKLQNALERRPLGHSPRVFSGPEGLVELVRQVEGDIVVGAISGAAGLPANIAALETGKDLALANKEALVLSGAILTRLATKHGRRLLPVDSEHSAVFQSLLSGRREEVESIILTASGGPFREASLEQMRRATKADALKHPTWVMGAKITIDSATLMNKALEVIEARWLFDLPPSKIKVVIHPQSIIHSLVQFHDGSVICQLGPPDMKIPIQYALTYPERLPLPVKRLQLNEIANLTFQAPDPARFPALRLAYEVLERGGTAPAVLNAANEVAVAAFLRDEICFPEIVEWIEQTLQAHSVIADPTLEDLFAADAWARDTAVKNHPTSRSPSR